MVRLHLHITLGPVFSLIDHRKQETTLRTSVRRFAKRARHTTTVNRSVQFPVLKTGTPP